MRDKISIAIPAFNAGRYIKETLQSVAYQTMLPHEVVVVDDCSTDNTLELVKTISKTYPVTLRVISNWKNKGIGFTRQNLAEVAEGDYIAFLSADDCYQKNFIEKSLPYLDEKTATYTAYWRCREDLSVFESFAPPAFSKKEVVDWALRKNMFINFSSVIIPKHVFQTVKFEAELRHGEDLIWLLDSLIAGLNWKEPAPNILLSYRLHQNQGTTLDTHRRGLEFELLWKHLRPRLASLGVPEATIQQAYMSSVKNANPTLLRRITSFVYHKIVDGNLT